VIVALRRGPVTVRRRGAPFCNAGPADGDEAGGGGGAMGIGGGGATGGAGCTGGGYGTDGAGDAGGCKRMERSR
jgi:hypothetical protein